MVNSYKIYLPIVAILSLCNVANAQNEHTFEFEPITIDIPVDTKKFEYRYNPEMEQIAINIGNHSLTRDAKKAAEKNLRTITDINIYKKLMDFDNETTVAYMIGGAKGVVKLAEKKSLNLGLKHSKIVAKQNT
jgi:hypothetical protein